MKIGILKEIHQGEKRVALVPSSIKLLCKKNHEVFVAAGAGKDSMYFDEEYEKNGAKIVRTNEELYELVDIILKIHPPEINPNTGKHEAEMLKENCAIISYLTPFKNVQEINIFKNRSITSFSMDFIPRITRAQSMDSLSSMATISGYKAVLIAANSLPKFFPLLMTAAGSIPPATVMVLGAGVAGLQAIATAKRLGAKVEAFDPRAAVKEQVESLGAIFISMENIEDQATENGYAKEQSEEFLLREREAIKSRLNKVDVVITTAQIFGKKPPVLITEDMIKLMKPGSVIVDIAAEHGGNCELTIPNEVVEKHGVKIHGEINLPSTIQYNASQMYSKNIVTLFNHLYLDAESGLDLEDEIVKSTLITYGGEIKNDLIKAKLSEGIKI